MGTLAPSRHRARWLWLLLPAGIVLAFNRLIVATLTYWQQRAGVIEPWVFFSLPFLSVVPPILLLAIWYRQRRRDHDLHGRIYDRAFLARDAIIGADRQRQE